MVVFTGRGVGVGLLTLSDQVKNGLLVGFCVGFGVGLGFQVVVGL